MTSLGKQVLKLKIENSAAGDNITIKDYLKELLWVLWKEDEGFSGKRPFGNSGWCYELYKPLVVAGLVDGEICQEYGDLLDLDKLAADVLIFEAIKSL